MSVLIFLGVLFVLILVHEFGHFITAKLSGMRVDEFGIGFPPKLFGKKFGETEYTLNLLPIGGFVRIYGEDPTTVEHNEHSDRSFSAQNRLWQAIVLLAGVTMNIIFAWFLIVIIFLIGMPAAVSEDAAGPNAELVVTEVVAGGPAAEVLVPGDTIVALNGYTEADHLTPTMFRNLIEESGGEPLALEVRSGNETRTVELSAKTGVIQSAPNQPAIGVAVSLVEITKASLGEAIVAATINTGAMIHSIGGGIYHLIADSFVGKADFSQVAGPVGIVGMVGDAAKFGITSLLMFTAIISVNLAIINLLPFPALDGGRLLFVAIEAVSRRSIDPVWISRLNMIGFALLMILMVLVTFHDISNIL